MAALPAEHDKYGYTDRWCNVSCTATYHVCAPPLSDERLRLNQLLDGFGKYEVGAVLFVAERLAMGRKVYGPLSVHDGRDWLTEASEELADFYVYLAAHAMKREGR